MGKLPARAVMAESGKKLAHAARATRGKLPCTRWSCTATTTTGKLHHARHANHQCTRQGGCWVGVRRECDDGKIVTLAMAMRGKGDGRQVTSTRCEGDVGQVAGTASVRTGKLPASARTGKLQAWGEGRWGGSGDCIVRAVTMVAVVRLQGGGRSEQCRGHRVGRRASHGGWQLWQGGNSGSGVIDATNSNWKDNTVKVT